MNNLTFINTQTIEQFKDEQKISKVSVKQNPHTGKLFFVYGAETGAVAVKGIPEHPMISLVQGEKGEPFYLLHEEAQGAPTIAEF